MKLVGQNLEKGLKLLSLVLKMKNPKSMYRSRATNGRSQLVAAPLSLQAKTHFLCVFYVVIWTSKQ